MAIALHQHFYDYTNWLNSLSGLTKFFGNVSTNPLRLIENDGLKKLTLDSFWVGVG
jgi:hypothetical protein